MRTVYGAGIALMKDNKVLMGKRADGQGWCIPAGKFDSVKDRTLSDTAIREFTEETGIVLDSQAVNTQHAQFTHSFCPYNRIDKKTGKIKETVLAKSIVFIVDSSYIVETDHDTDNEMLELKYFSLEDVFQLDKIFPPSLITLNYVFNEELAGGLMTALKL